MTEFFDTITCFFYYTYQNIKYCLISKPIVDETSYLLSSKNIHYMSINNDTLIKEEPRYMYSLEESMIAYNDTNNLKNIFSNSIIAENTSVDVENSISIMSYNIGQENEINNITKLINYIDPDVLTLQECHTISKSELSNFMKLNLKKYITLEFVGDDNTCILSISIKSEKFRINHHGMKWLSPTPNMRSKIWDINETKIIAYMNITDNITGEVFWVFTSQLCEDPSYKILLTNMLTELIKKITKNSDDKIILTCNINKPFNDKNMYDEILTTLQSNDEKMKNESANIYTYINDTIKKINGTLLNKENKTYGKYDFIISKNIESAICYAIFLRNTDNVQQTNKYLPLILYINNKITLV